MRIVPPFVRTYQIPPVVLPKVPQITEAVYHTKAVVENAPNEIDLYQLLGATDQVDVGEIDGTYYDQRRHLINLGDARTIQPGRAVLFDGATQRINTGESWLPETADWSMVFRFQFLTTANNDYIAGQSSAANTNGVVFGLNGGSFRLYWDNAGSGDYTTELYDDFSSYDTDWHQIYIQRTGDTILGCLDNSTEVELVGEDADRPVEQSGFNVGCYYGSSLMGNAKVSDLRVLRRTLTTAERTAIYNQGIYKNRLIPGQPDGADYYRWLMLDDNEQLKAVCCVTGNEYTITGGNASSPYEGDDVPWSRQNIIGFSET